MKKYWYRRILIMALVFFVSVGGSYLLIEQKKDAMRREVSAQTSEEDLVIPGGMPVGIYMKTKGVMVLDTQKIKGEDGAEYEPALHIVKAGDYITGFNGKDINTKNELVEAVSSFSEQKAKLDICRKGETIHVKMDMIQCEDGTKNSESGCGIMHKDLGPLLIWTRTVILARWDMESMISIQGSFLIFPMEHYI